MSITPTKNKPLTVSPSSFRMVFGSPYLRREFVKFLKTIFYLLDEQKVLAKMDEILANPRKSDKKIYEELLANIDCMRRPLPAFLYQLKSLFVLQKGMGEQARELLQNFRGEEFHTYLEIYFKRYFTTIQKTAQVALDRKVYDVSDKPYQGTLKEKLEAGSLFGRFPYRDHLPLNDPTCTDPDRQPERTHKPLGKEIANGEIDLVACLGGLHHIPKKRVDPFVASIAKKLKPGGVVLLRDHNVRNASLHAIASVVHSFVNAANGVKWEVEKREVREFHSAKHWTEVMRAHNLKRVSNKNLILEDDPTKNGMMAFVKTPQNLKELRSASRMRKDCVRSPDGTRATWIEWGNVRYSKQFAEFIQTRHAYAFDYLGHLKQHMHYFTTYLQESRKEMPLKNILFSDNFAMNLFILTSTIVQCVSGILTSLPSRALARITKGVDWREATDLTALERQEAQIETEYCTFIDHTPFYMFPYISKIKGLWSAIWNSNESRWTKLTSAGSAFFSTLGLIVKAAVCAPIRLMYTQGGQYLEPDRVAILIHDPKNQFKTGKKRLGEQTHTLQVVYQTPNGYKQLLVPRYRPFTELCKGFAHNKQVKLLEIGSQRKVTVDVMYKPREKTLKRMKGVKLLYELDKLQDAKKRRYATYEVHVSALAAFERQVGTQKIEYVHE